MDTIKLENWAQHLIDMGMRNNLLNFKDHKTNTVEIIAPSSEDLFKAALKSGQLEVFEPNYSDAEALNKEETDQLALMSGDEKKDEEIRRQLKKDVFSKHFSPRLKANQVLLYNISGLSGGASLNKIEKNAREFMTETGANVAYMSVGFVHWADSKTKEKVLRAPILLIPVEFEKASSVHPYVIKPNGDEVIINPSFTYRIKEEYGIELPEYNDEGLGQYLDKIADIVKRLGWTVSDEIELGIFSFNKTDMYQDIMDNKDQILANPNIQAILGEPSEAEEGESSRISGFPLNGGPIPKKVVHRANAISVLNNVVDADSSQIEAIETAKSGVSFVLQGPPGTGKSQTITNIIAEFLSDGKKVLFVSEKQAALNVVYNQLYKANLADFCLELHSHKANKKAVITELAQTLQLTKSGVSSAANRELEAKEEAQRKLNEYDLELHLKRPGIDKSLYELFEEYALLKDVIEVNWPMENIESKGQDYIDKAERLLKQYQDISKQIGYDYRKSPWYGFIQPVLTYQEGKQINRELASVKDYLENLNKTVNEINEKFDLKCKSLGEVKSYAGLFESLSEIPPSFAELFKPANFNNFTAALNNLEVLAKRANQEQKAINSVYNNELQNINARDFNNRLRAQHNGRLRIFSKDYKNLIATLANARKDRKKLSYEEAVAETERLMAFQSLLANFNGASAPIIRVLGPLYNGLNTDWDAVHKLLNQIRDAQSRLNLEYLADASKDEFEAKKREFKETAQALENIGTGSSENYEKVAGYFNPAIFDLKSASSEEVAAKLEDLIKDNESIVEWSRFRDLERELGEAGLLSYLNYVLENGIAIDDLVNAYKKQIIVQWIQNIIMSTPVLSRFDRREHERTIEIFSEKDKIQFDINKAKIRAKLLAGFPSRDVAAPGSQISILEREAQKKRRHKSIRKLLSEVGDLAQTLKPVFLMSPQSVSTFLDPKAIHFDVVIFDEASQVFPQDALGAIYRGDQLIVVGDSKQMPPTNFFMSTVQGDNYDEDYEDIADFDSILDICSVSMRRLSLRWHYRSRYESLIAFSNKNFYNNDLITFPSPKADEKWAGIDYHYVDGVYEGGINRKEAEYIVDLIYENIEKFPERSLGVVAFNSKQEDLIEQLLFQRRLERPDKEFFFNKAVKEPFFIKNLETVQGDERDTIIFSSIYGKNPQGIIRHNFGPLSRPGGERRLNVAITRAKTNVQFVSSMHHTDLDLKRTTYDGPRLFREYLDYAENGNIALSRGLTVNPYEITESPFEQEVYEFLKNEGFDLDTQVGCSGFRIDMALKRPDTSDYVLAIECDGASYHSSKNARDRDRLRQQVLENMGWKFYRIWSTDWFKNSAMEKQSLKKAAIQALKEAGLEWPYKKPEEEEPKNVSEVYKAVEEEMAQEPKPSKFSGVDWKIAESTPPTAEQEEEKPDLVAAELAQEAILREIPRYNPMEGITDEEPVSGFEPIIETQEDAEKLKVRLTAVEPKGQPEIPVDADFPEESMSETAESNQAGVKAEISEDQKPSESAASLETEMAQDETDERTGTEDQPQEQIEEEKLSVDESDLAENRGQVLKEKTKTEAVQENLSQEPTEEMMSQSAMEEQISNESLEPEAQPQGANRLRVPKEKILRHSNSKENPETAAETEAQNETLSESEEVPLKETTKPVFKSVVNGEPSGFNSEEEPLDEGIAEKLSFEEKNSLISDSFSEKDYSTEKSIWEGEVQPNEETSEEEAILETENEEAALPEGAIILGGPIGIPFTLLPEMAQSIIDALEEAHKEPEEFNANPLVTINRGNLAIMILDESETALVDSSALKIMSFAPKEKTETPVGTENTQEEESPVKAPLEAEAEEGLEVEPNFEMRESAGIVENPSEASTNNVEEDTAEETPFENAFVEANAEEILEAGPNFEIGETADDITESPLETSEADVEETAVTEEIPFETAYEKANAEEIPEAGPNFEIGETAGIAESPSEPSMNEAQEAVSEVGTVSEQIESSFNKAKAMEETEEAAEPYIEETAVEAEEPVLSVNNSEEGVAQKPDESQITEESFSSTLEEPEVEESEEEAANETIMEPITPPAEAVIEEALKVAEVNLKKVSNEESVDNQTRARKPVGTIKAGWEPLEKALREKSEATSSREKGLLLAQYLDEEIDALMDVFVDALLEKLGSIPNVMPTKKPLFKNNNLKDTKEALKAKGKNTIASLFSQVAETAPTVEENVKVTIPLDEELEFPKYEMVDIKDVIARNPSKNFQEFVKEVLEVEAPLSEDWLLKRCLTVFGGETVTKEFKQKYLRFMRDCEKNHIVRSDGFLFLDDRLDHTAVQFRAVGEEGRSLDRISPVELAAGMLELLKWEYSMDKEKLYRTILNECGFVRLTKPVYMKFESALRLLGDEVEVDGNRISIK